MCAQHKSMSRRGGRMRRGEECEHESEIHRFSEELKRILAELSEKILFYPPESVAFIQPWNFGVPKPKNSSVCPSLHSLTNCFCEWIMNIHNELNEWTFVDNRRLWRKRKKKKVKERERTWIILCE